MFYVGMTFIRSPEYFSWAPGTNNTVPAYARNWHDGELTNLYILPSCLLCAHICPTKHNLNERPNWYDDDGTTWMKYRSVSQCRAWELWWTNTKRILNNDTAYSNISLDNEKILAEVPLPSREETTNVQRYRSVGNSGDTKENLLGHGH